MIRPDVTCESASQQQDPGSTIHYATSGHTITVCLLYRGCRRGSSTPHTSGGAECGGDDAGVLGYVVTIPCWCWSPCGAAVWCVVCFGRASPPSYETPTVVIIRWPAKPTELKRSE